MFNVEDETRRIEQLYSRLTGTAPAKDLTRSPIPADVDAEGYVRDRLRKLEGVLMGMGAVDPALHLPVVAPRVTFSHRLNEWSCAAELPGVSKSDVSVQLTGAELRISALRRAPEGQPLYAEFSPCRFERGIPVPPAIRPDTASARLEDGILVVRFAVQSTTTAQQIEIGAA